MKIRLEKSLAQNKTSQIVVPVVAVFLALLFCGVFLAVTGRDPFEVYQAMFAGALGSEYGISETIVKMIPLALCGLGIAVAFRMQIWNIGAEGQFYTLLHRLLSGGGLSGFQPVLSSGCCRSLPA